MINKKKYSGITLLELLITISLMSFLLVMGFQSFSVMINRQYSQSAIQQAGFAIKKARYFARAKGVTTKLNFPVGSNNYSIVAGGVSITNDANFDATSGILPDKTKILSNNCSDIYFYIDGTLVDSNNQHISTDCKISIGYDNGIQKSLTVYSNSGSVVYD